MTDLHPSSPLKTFTYQASAAKKLRKEISAAWRMRVTVMNDILQHSRPGLRLAIEGIVRYVYVSSENDDALERRVKHVIQDSDNYPNFLDENTGIDCECFYSRRMRIPCWRALCVCIDAKHRKLLFSSPSNSGATSALL